MTTPTHIALLAYPRMTALDLLGPHHILSMLPGAQIHIVAATRDPVTSDLGLVLTPSATFEACPERVDVLFCPGGTSGTVQAMQDPDTLRFLRSRAPTARWITSVCTGSLVLGAAGLLRGRRATTHWVALDLLSRFGATPVAERVVQDGNVLTGAGVTSGLDFALTLVQAIAGETTARLLQLVSEYDPAPPFDSGSPARAREQDTATVRAWFTPFRAEVSSVRTPPE